MSVEVVEENVCAVVESLRSARLNLSCLSLPSAFVSMSAVMCSVGQYWRVTVPSSMHCLMKWNLILMCFMRVELEVATLILAVLSA